MPLFILIITILFFLTQSYATSPGTAGKSNDITEYSPIDYTKVINKFKLYLKEIKLVAVDFTQRDSNNVITNGKLLISKPYKFRCNYYSPFPLLIVGNKNYVSLYDYDMNTLSRLNSTENIFNFLLTDSDFDKHFHIESAEENMDFMTIKFYHNLSERSGKITVNKSTQQISAIEIFEDNNIITITFNKILKVKNFAEDLFHIRNTDIFGPPQRLNKIEIEKKYTI